MSKLVIFTTRFAAFGSGLSLLLTGSFLVAHRLFPAKTKPPAWQFLQTGGVFAQDSGPATQYYV
jgi:hypothetical protein